MKKVDSFLHMNCIVVFNKTKDKVLFCRRRKDPFAGRLNFVGGKVEEGEASEDAAYRELEEETGISQKEIRLFRLMDITYYHQAFILEMFVGKLENDVELREEKNPLLWLPLTEDFTNRERFAGEQNIAHIINIAMLFPVPERLSIWNQDLRLVSSGRLGRGFSFPAGAFREISGAQGNSFLRDLSEDQMEYTGYRCHSDDYTERLR